MPVPCTHRIVRADRHTVPRPFRAFAVRSEEPRHAWQARSPYGRVHLVATAFLDAGTLAGMASAGHARVRTAAFSDIEHARTSLAELSAAGPSAVDVAGGIASALQSTGVLGSEPGAYRHSVDARIDFLGACGSGFHNDVSRHWSACLFWLLALDVADVEFVMPHAGVRVALSPGDLIVFDPSMAHGLCRPRDAGEARAASFESGGNCRQMFITGELPLSDADWAALGVPWRPIEWHEDHGALDLMVAEFDEHSGAIKGLRGLRDSMKRSTCHVDAGADADAAGTASSPESPR